MRRGGRIKFRGVWRGRFKNALFGGGPYVGGLEIRLAWRVHLEAGPGKLLWVRDGTPWRNEDAGKTKPGGMFQKKIKGSRKERQKKVFFSQERFGGGVTHL